MIRRLYDVSCSSCGLHLFGLWHRRGLAREAAKRRGWTRQLWRDLCPSCSEYRP